LAVGPDVEAERAVTGEREPEPHERVLVQRCDVPLDVGAAQLGADDRGEDMFGGRIEHDHQGSPEIRFPSDGALPSFWVTNTGSENSLDRGNPRTIHLASPGWDDAFAADFERLVSRPRGPDELRPARVSRVDRGFCTALTADGPVRASFSGGLLAGAV